MFKGKAVKLSSNYRYGNNFLFVYLLISLGAGLEVSGSNWDIIWHALNNVETFFTLPHSIIYSGVVLTLGSVIYGTISLLSYDNKDRFHHNNIEQKNNSNSDKISRLSISYFSSSSIVASPLFLALIGVTLQLSAGPFDFWWHNQFGFDGLLSPPHSILAAGMLLASLGALIGVFQIHKHENMSTSDVNRTSVKVNSVMTIAFSVLWIVSVGMIFMFTLPFSKGQYFDFNPQPLAGLIANATLMPFVTGLVFFVAAKTLLIYNNDKAVKKATFPNIIVKSWRQFPFMFTTIVASVMFLQIITTITSNPYFISNLYLYLLNIIPAIICDILLYKHFQSIGHDNKGIIKTKSSKLFSSLNQKITVMDQKRIALIVSSIISIFYITIFYPWSFDLYKHYFFGLDENVVMRNISIFQHLFLTNILPVIIPYAIVMGFIGGLIMNKIMKWKTK
jgi:hypothetical protein